MIIFACSADITYNISISELDYSDDLKVISRAEWGWQPLDKSSSTALN